MLKVVTQATLRTWPVAESKVFVISCSIFLVGGAQVSGAVVSGCGRRGIRDELCISPRIYCPTQVLPLDRRFRDEIRPGPGLRSGVQRLGRGGMEWWTADIPGCSCDNETVARWQAWG